MSTTFQGPDQTRLRQSQITDYLMTQRPKRGMPVSVLHGQTPGTSANAQTSETPNHFATILDLPNELLLTILDELRRRNLNPFLVPVSLLLPTTGDDSREEKLLDPARRLYAVCRRFHSLFAEFALESLCCIGRRSVDKLRKITMQETFHREQIRRVNSP